MKNKGWTWLPVAAICTSAFATTYYTTEQAQQAIFPGEQLTPAFVRLSDEQAGQIAKITGLNVVHRDIKAWKAAKG